MSTTQEQIDLLESEKQNNINEITSLDNQVNTLQQAIDQQNNLIDQYNVQIENCNTKITQLNDDNLILDEIIVELSGNPLSKKKNRQRK